jgi:hypothetical protein
MLLGLCALRFRNCLWRVDLLFWLGILRDMDGDESDWTRVLAGVRNIPQGFLGIIICILCDMPSHKIGIYI